MGECPAAPAGPSAPLRKPEPLAHSDEHSLANLRPNAGASSHEHPRTGVASLLPPIPLSAQVIAITRKGGPPLRQVKSWRGAELCKTLQICDRSFTGPTHPPGSTAAPRPGHNPVFLIAYPPWRILRSPETPPIGAYRWSVVACRCTDSVPTLPLSLGALALPHRHHFPHGPFFTV
jgi:hypothetical protein